MKKNRRLCILLLFLEAVVCGILSAAALVQYRNGKRIEVPLSSWQSDYITYDDGWYVDEGILRTEEPINMIYGPYAEAERGTYSVTVDYACDHDQACLVSAAAGNDVFIKTGQARLGSRLTRAAYRFTLTEDIDSLEVVVRYNGKGFLRIKDIEIQQNSVGARRALAAAFFLSVFLDLCLCFRKRMAGHKNLVLTVGGITMLSSLPLFMRGITRGHDIIFHLLRIEGIAEEMRCGSFPVRISSLWMDGYGYPVSVFYGDILLYVPAVLRLIGYPVTAVYKAYVFLINFGTAVISYICFKRIFSKDRTALLASLAYVTAGYRMVNIYVRAAAGEFSAMMFLPVIALALHQIYTQESTDWKSYRHNALLLALGMSGLACTHVLSTEMTVSAVAFACILLWKKTLRKNTLRVFLLAAVQAAVFSAYFIIPFADYYLNVNVKIRNEVNGIIQKIQNQGAYTGQYFSFFQNMFGVSANGLKDRMGLTPGPVLMLALVLAALLWVNKKAAAEMKCLAVLSSAMLFMASDVFPWNHLAQNYKIGRIMSQVQFPWRYIGMASACLAVLFGFVLQHYEQEGSPGILKGLPVLAAGTCIFMSCFYVSSYTDSAYDMIYCYDTAELDTYSALYGGQYLRPGTDPDSFTNKISAEHMLEASLQSRQGCRMELYCRTAGRCGSVEVPVLNYKGYRVTDEHGNDFEVTDGAENVVRFTVPEHFSGKVIIRFVEPWYWKAGELVSAAAVLWLCIKALYRAGTGIRAGLVRR